MTKQNYRCIGMLFLCLAAVIAFPEAAYSQVAGNTQANGSQSNNLVTAVPFLLVMPDARTGAMGDAGVAVYPDANASAINPAKMAFLNDRSGVSLSYTPWLRSLTSDINLAYLSGYYRLDERNTVGASFRFFSLGEIPLTDNNRQDLGTYSPNELAFDVSYARKFGEEFSIGTTLRYINSNLSTGKFTAGQQINAGNSVAVDVSGFYTTETWLFNTDTRLSAGLNISNIGTKMGYTETGSKYFLPSNLRLGGAATFSADDLNDFTVALDFNKLLVPTQPIYNTDGSISSGVDPNRSVPAGIFGSFTDAPGGFSEELQEVNIGAGLEYLYDKKFALRGGYFYESPNKGNRRYVTLGAGFTYKQTTINFSYLLASVDKSPMANTLRFSLLFNFGSN
ncbi:type IX secretion system outer membrane channel protein PorV [Pedobacter sp. SYP-B3415]|uniref:type IX secretion system outer membrane channel protein PorV n=1 Tax=Pedobacter sp. SYP-B3415 TaxID=2496641 RepID=UPI001F10DF73|nr:type IX secretion system outer membrane channel protein PorV [Pedobacter sp. SYP-B3415]